MRWIAQQPSGTYLLARTSQIVLSRRQLHFFQQVLFMTPVPYVPSERAVQGIMTRQLARLARLGHGANPVLLPRAISLQCPPAASPEIYTQYEGFGFS